MQLTWKRLPARIRDLYGAIVVCDKGEEKALARQDIRCVGVKAKNAGVKRQWILDNADDPLILMLDDDLTSWAEVIDGKLVNCVDHAFTPHFVKFEKLLLKHAQGSFGARLFAQHRPPIEYNRGRHLRALGFNKALMPDGAKFRMGVMEDLDMQLQLIRAGCEGFTYNGLVQQQMANNSAGGCSRYRTPEYQRKCAEQMAKLHPGYVSVVVRKYRKSYFEGTNEQYNVTVQWNKAHKEAHQ